jgi:hypothetical protein
MPRGLEGRHQQPRASGERSSGSDGFTFSSKASVSSSQRDQTDPGPSVRGWEVIGAKWNRSVVGNECSEGRVLSMTAARSQFSELVQRLSMAVGRELAVDVAIEFVDAVWSTMRWRRGGKARPGHTPHISLNRRNCASGITGITRLQQDQLNLVHLQLCRQWRYAEYLEYSVSPNHAGER